MKSDIEAKAEGKLDFDADVRALAHGGWLRFERGDGRWYLLGWQLTLFGWAVVRVHGGNGVRSERKLCPLVFESFEKAEKELVRQVRRRVNRGYVMQKL